MDFSSLHQLEIPLIKYLQSFRSPALDTFFLITNIFDHNFIYLLIVVWMWNVIGKKEGFHLFYLIGIGGFFHFLKRFFAQPRPYDLLSCLSILPTSGYGFPSGAATAAMITFGFIFLLKSSKLPLKILSIFLILIVGLTRIYLGAHFPSDVLGGYLLGFIILLGYKFLIPFLETFTEGISKLLLFSMHVVFIAFWIALTRSLDCLIALFGAMCGYVLLNSASSLKMQVLSLWSKYAAGCFAILGAGLFYITLISIKPSIINTSLRSFLALFLLFIIGFWISFNHILFLQLRELLLNKKKKK